MKAALSRFFRDDAGQDLIEYGLLVGVITAGIILAIKTVGSKVANYYNTLVGRLPG